MDLRPYLSPDRDACLAIYDSNAASPEDRKKFEAFLSNPDGPFFVMEHDGRILGCGGFTTSAEPGIATLVWGMVRSEAQGQGLGRYLLMYRLREIGKLPGIQRVRLLTSRPAARFFEGQGFKVAGEVDGQVEMVKKLTVCA